MSHFPAEGENVQGYYCFHCKEEWLSNSMNKNQLATVEYKHVAHHMLPSFWCMQVSDTGSYIKWKNINKTPGRLKRGDHVAWLRPFLGYWHHAIVEEVTNDSIRVIEWSGCSILRSTRMKSDLCGNCCWSPMYKAYYPEEVENQNPSELVLMRAEARLGNYGYCPFSDNCEHFASFCKTGLHRSNQVFQFKVSVQAWIRKIVAIFLHVTIVMSISEGIETAGGSNKHSVGILFLVLSELTYFIVVIIMMWCHDSKQTDFIVKKDACLSAAIKAAAQSVMLVLCAILLSVLLLDRIQGEKIWSVAKSTCIEILLGMVGGMLGNILGFFLFSFLPYPCCRNTV
ncbi:NC domain protein [Apostichopus japonicus]|uniref:NC domain protein n=1 Tax=Stichopus japonicus TaxID=307972 RepID=A0A2G8KMB7_STIJA|nr:NC domain protein [Apostichopus japonicus]